MAGGHVCRGSPVLFRVNQAVRCDVVEDLIQEAPGQVICHTKIHVQVVFAVVRGNTGNFPRLITGEFKHLDHHGQNLFRGRVAGKQKIETGTAAHGSEIEDTGFPNLMIP